MSDHEVVEGIVMPSIQANQADDISGCLWFGPGRFLQVLEGGADVVDALYARIERDRRHSEVTLLARRGIDQRRFQRWSLKVVHGDETTEVARLVEELVSRQAAEAHQPNGGPGRPGPGRQAIPSMMVRAVSLLLGAKHDIAESNGA